MSGLIGRVGALEIQWKKAPKGSDGSGVVVAGGREYTVSWKQDSEGLYLEFPHGVFGYDIHGEVDEAEGGGLVYRVSERGSNELYAGVKFKGAGEAAASAGASGKKKSARVRAQMPGKIVRVMVKVGDHVEKDQSLVVMEAMKMENEIRALQSGKVEAVKVIEGQAVESGADLVLIGSE